MALAAWISLGAAALLLRVGFALYLCGISRAKTAGSAVFRAVGETAVGIVAFWAFGAAILTGSPKLIFGLGAQFPDSLLFPAAIALISSTAITGATLERSKPVVWVAGAILMSGLITPLAWHFAWSPWLGGMGFYDLAGASFLYFAGGIAAAVAAIAVGARSGKYNRDGSTNAILGHNVPFATTGALIVLAMWPAIISGFVLMKFDWAGTALPQSVEPVVFNSVLAGAAGTISAMLYSRLRHSKLDPYLVYLGLLGGLVSIAAGADLFATPFAFLTGAVAGIVVPYAAFVIELIFKIDDPSGAIAVGAVGGAWSMLAATLFARGTLGDHLHRLMGQCLGLGLIGLITVAISATVFVAIRAAIGIRAIEADEIDGLDLAEHDMNAYPDFPQTMIKSYHLREM